MYREDWSTASRPGFGIRHRQGVLDVGSGRVFVKAPWAPDSVPCVMDLPGVGKHLKDHLYYALPFPAPGIGVSRADIGLAAGPDALREPEGPLPADPADDMHLTSELLELKSEAE